MQRANAAVPGAAPALLGQDEASGALAMQFLPPDRYPPVEGAAARRRRRPRLRRRGRGSPGAHPCRHRGRPGDRRRISHRRDLLRHPPGAVSGRDRPRAPGPRAAARRAGRDDPGQQARAGAWRRQPEEHPARSGRPGVPGRRMRLVGRPGVRPRLLPQSPAAEMPVDAARHAPASSPASTRWRRLSRRRRPGSRRPRWRRAPRICCPACSSPGWMASRRSSTSPPNADKDRVRRAARALLAAPGRARSATCATPGRRSLPHDRHRDRLRARPPGVGQPRPADGGGRGAAGRRRRRTRHRPGRRLHRHRRGARPARRRRRLRRLRRDPRGGQRERRDRPRRRRPAMPRIRRRSTGG